MTDTFAHLREMYFQELVPFVRVWQHIQVT